MARKLLVLFMLLSLTLTIQAQDEQQIEDLLSRMSLAEKIGQMTLVEKNSLTPEDVNTYFIGGVLSGGGGYPNPNTPEAWAQMINSFQQAALESPLAIPMIYGIDAVHGHNNLQDAVIFPHNIGLGAARNPEIVAQIGEITAQDMMATGIYWNYSPVVAVPQDIRWGRTYEGYGENTELVTELGLAMMRGLQGENYETLATVKHYVGDGGAVWGTSPFGENNIDRGVTDVDEETLRRIHLPPYQATIDAGALSIMASFTSWGGLHMHAQHYLLTDVLKGELGFDGFVVSDWQAIDLISPDYYEAVVSSINAGIDMNMVPHDFKAFIDTLTRAVDNGDVPVERIDDAVRRILRAKIAMGLFDEPFAKEELQAEVGSDEHRAVAREAVSQSLVLLKNDNNTLPLAKDAPVIFVAGSGADDIGIQSGGWTIEWQGKPGNITSGTTILEAIQAVVSPDTQVEHRRVVARFDNVTDADGNPIKADVGIVVLSEMPYAEWQGDSATLALSPADLNAVRQMREISEKLVVILLSGRPMIITEPLITADAFVAAWLPGTEGAGITDVLFGDKPFTGKLSYTWPRSIEQIPFDFENLPTEGCDAPLFPYGYGLTGEDNSSAALDLAQECAPETAQETETAETTPEVIKAEATLADFESDFFLRFDEYNNALGFAPWGNQAENVKLSVRQLVPFSAMALSHSNTVANNVLAIDYDISEWGGFTHVMTDGTNWVGQDWTAYNALRFWLYGNSTGGIIQVEIFDNRNPDATGDTAERWYYRITDDYDGWKEFTIPFTLFQRRTDWQPSGAPFDELGLNEVSGYAFGFPVNMGAQTAYLDNIQLVNIENSSEVSSSSDEGKQVVEIDMSIGWDSRQWELVWSDEFEGDAGTPVNAEYWTHDIGGEGWGNNELEYYTDRVENASLDGSGNLAITARQENPADYNCHYGKCEYTSARLISRDKVEFTFGRVEARIKIPRGQGIWPAFWMLGSNFYEVNWPNSGEIDILENIGHEPRTIYGTVHGPGYSGSHGLGGTYTGEADFADDFHVYAIDWDENVIRWYVDGNLYHMLSPNNLSGQEWVFNHDFFLLLNVAVGGNWPGYPDETTQFPQTMLVDYVRVYRLAQ